MSLLGINFHNLFDWLYLGILWSHELGRGFERLTQIDLSQPNMLSSQYIYIYILKKYRLKFFLVKLYFY